MASNLTLSGLLGTLKSTFRINKLTLDASALSVARTVNVPDKTGTLAMTSDITGTNSGTNTGDQTNISGNAATATTASACSGNAATATTAANLNGAWAQMPTGTRLVFAQAAAPTGWVQITDDSATNRMLRVVNTAGGGVAGSHSPISCSVVAAHTHSFTTGNVSADHTHTTTTGNESADHAHTTTTGGISANHTHTFTGTAMTAHDHGTVAHTHTVPSTGNDDLPVSALFLPGYGSVLGTTTSSSVTVDVNTASAGTPAGTNAAGSVDHTHTGTSGGRSAAHTHTGTSGGASANHTHSGSTDNGSSATNWTPRYIDTIICSKS